MSRTLLVVAGEDSGDLHGGELLRCLKGLRPDLRLVGIGGPRMAPFLDRRLAAVEDLAVMGFVEVLRHLPRLNRIFDQVLAAAREERIDGALLIDYPGFNLRLARALRARMPGVGLHQYVCPQVWAWKRGRIPVLGRTLDTLYCLFGFEPALFEGLPVRAVFLGHPLVDLVVPEVDRAAFFAEAGLDPARPLVALLPGSRRGEVQRLLPPMAALVADWAVRRPEVQWVVPVAPSLDPGVLRAGFPGLPVTLVEGRSYAARAHADAALVASGTATLETALLGTPFAMTYRLNPLTYLMARRLVKLPFVSLPNLVAGRGVVQELLQGEVNPERMGQVLAGLLDPAQAQDLRAGLAEVRGQLGATGAAARVAADLAARL